ncbi:MAG TPA: NBR1-Ig-like domain-containing protein [Anaerolineales bacterium]|nr:NBR1-Ig-like domain-containing protein [Anaerolineales bacterium]
MNTRRRPALALLLIAAVILTGCNFPHPPSPQEVASTAAAETVSVQLTLVSAATPTVPSTNTPVPPPATNTPTPPPTVPPATATPGCSDNSQFVSDVTVPDNTVMTPGQNFTKTWRLRNTGSCSWSTAYDAVFVEGNAMGGNAAVPMAGVVPPNSTVDISVGFSAPSSNGTFRATYRMRNDADVLFGTIFYVQIVVGPTPTPTVVVYRTGKLKIDNSYKADLDAGKITGDSNADIWLHAVTADERYLEPQNGAKIKKMSGTPSYDNCSGASLSSSAVSFSDFGTGDWFCYKTSDNRYGRFEVDEEGSDFVRIDFRTWD